MCAIDALGIPLMTGSDVVIDSADPDSGTPIRIQRRGDEWTWQPATAVVVIGRTDAIALAAQVFGSLLAS
jgi:alkylmercury lyase-like protein